MPGYAPRSGSRTSHLRRLARRARWDFNRFDFRLALPDIAQEIAPLLRTGLDTDKLQLQQSVGGAGATFELPHLLPVFIILRATFQARRLLLDPVLFFIKLLARRSQNRVYFLCGLAEGLLRSRCGF